MGTVPKQRPSREKGLSPFSCLVVLVKLSIVLAGIFFVITILPAFADKTNGLVILLSDYGREDFFVGAVKGAIYSKFLGANVDEISVELPRSNIRDASYILAHAAREFPAGTVFCVSVELGASGKKRNLAAETEDGKFYVTPDNGVLTLVLRQSRLKEAREITNPLFLRKGDSLASLFPGRDIYGPAAASLAMGMDFAAIGPPAMDLTTFPITEPKLDRSELMGEVEHINETGNILTNIPQALAAQLGAIPGKILALGIGAERLDAPFVKNYGDVTQGSWLVLVNGSGNLEIARNQANANAILQSHDGTVVRIRLLK